MCRLIYVAVLLAKTCVLFMAIEASWLNGRWAVFRVMDAIFRDLCSIFRVWCFN